MAQVDWMRGHSSRGANAIADRIPANAKAYTRRPVGKPTGHHRND